MSSPSIQLLAEIAFWREMLDADDHAHTQSAQERMRHALALAEWKLLVLEESVAETDGATGEWADSPLTSRREH